MRTSIILQQRLASLMPDNHGVVCALRTSEGKQQRLGRATIESCSDALGMGVELTNGEESLHIQIASDATDAEILRLGYAVLSFALRAPVPGRRILDLVSGYVYDCETGETRYL